MPQLYNAAVITDVGIALLNRAQAGEVSIQFTRMAVGNGVYREEEKTLSQLQKSTSLRSEKNSYPLSSVDIISDNSVKLTAIITNQDLVTEENLVADGYYINEMGLYAKEKDGDGSTEILYSIVTTAAENGDYMPPYNGHTPAQIIQEYYATISNSADVSIYLTDTGALMLAEDAEKRFQEVLEAIPPVDSGLDTESENPVQNKVITARIAELVSQLSTEWDAQKRYIDTKIADLINGAPETLDTLKEVADAIQENETIVDALNAAIVNKVDKVAGKGLSTKDFTAELKDKLDAIQAGAKANVQSDWNVTDTNSDAFIKHKPKIPTKTSELEDDAGFGSSKVTVDSEMSETSTNPVQNRAIAAYINKLHGSTLHGFRINQAESDPDNIITYIEDSVLRTPAYMDYEKDVFSYGGWDREWFIRNLMPCMLSYGGYVSYELNKDNYAQKKGGGDSDNSNANFAGNAMIGMPKVFWKIAPKSDDVADIFFCDENMDGTFNYWSHMDNNGKEIPYCYMPAYNGSLVSNRLRSLSGQAPMTSKTVQQEVTYAKANNLTSDIIWYTEVFSDRMLINLLLLIIGKSTDTQTVFGHGNNTGRQAGIKSSGTMDKKGLFWGSQDNVSGVKVFGIEHYWGNLWRRIGGWVNDRGVQKIKLTYGTTDGSTANGYNLDGNGYISVQNSAPTNVSGGFTRRSVFTNGILPVMASGSASTYFCDGLWADNSQIDYARVGGSAADGTLVGALCSFLYLTNSSADWNCCASLSCKPLA